MVGLTVPCVSNKHSDLFATQTSGWPPSSLIQLFILLPLFFLLLPSLLLPPASPPPSSVANSKEITIITKKDVSNEVCTPPSSPSLHSKTEISELQRHLL